MPAMEGPARDEHGEPEAPAYEAPAIEVRESLSDPLIGTVSGGMMLGVV
jgi:hypothetical protein